MKEKIKRLFNKIKDKVKAKLLSFPIYIKFLGLKRKLAVGILKALLAIFNVIGPIWNFFFIKKPDGDPERSPKVPLDTQSMGLN